MEMFRCAEASLLGYRKGDNGKPEIIPKEAEIGREIFRSYLDGMSLTQIANTLNKDMIHLSTPSAKPRGYLNDGI